MVQACKNIITESSSVKEEKQPWANPYKTADVKWAILGNNGFVEIKELLVCYTISQSCEKPGKENEKFFVLDTSSLRTMSNWAQES